LWASTVEKAAVSAVSAVSDAVRVFLTRIVADKELPFSIKAPNEASRTAIAEADQIVRRRRPRFANADDLLNGLKETSRK
jgi:DNA-damage-inducible protein J